MGKGGRQYVKAVKKDDHGKTISWNTHKLLQSFWVPADGRDGKAVAAAVVAADRTVAVLPAVRPANAIATRASEQLRPAVRDRSLPLHYATPSSFVAPAAAYH